MHPPRLPQSGTVYIIDPERRLEPVIATKLSESGWEARICSSPEGFTVVLDANRPACVVIEASIAEQIDSSIRIVLSEHNTALPVIHIQFEGQNIELQPEAHQAIALETVGSLISKVGQALKEDEVSCAISAADKRLETLTERELEICDLISRGFASKQIALELGISVRTVHHHRQHILDKTGAANAAELVSLLRLAQRSEP